MPANPIRTHCNLKFWFTLDAPYGVRTKYPNPEDDTLSIEQCCDYVNKKLQETVNWQAANYDMFWPTDFESKEFQATFKAVPPGSANIEVDCTTIVTGPSAITNFKASGLVYTLSIGQGNIGAVSDTYDYNTDWSSSVTVEPFDTKDYYAVWGTGDTWAGY